MVVEFVREVKFDVVYFDFIIGGIEVRKFDELMIEVFGIIDRGKEVWKDFFRDF